MAQQGYDHILLGSLPTTTDFKKGGGGNDKATTKRNRLSHSAYLAQRFKAAWQEAESERTMIQAQREGVYLEFMSDPGAELVTKSLEDLRSKKHKVRLLNVRTEDGVTYATVYVPNEKKKSFLKKIEEYASKDTDKGNPKHADLMNSIADLRKALLVESFWQDHSSLIPGKDKQWCEVWLRGDGADVLKRFEDLLQVENIEAATGHIRFPERTVKAVKVSRNDLERITSCSDDIAEFRRAKETAAFWAQMENRDQAEWAEDLLKRTTVSQDPSIAVCILDTGVNNGHPLLAPVLRAEDCQAVEPGWGTHDHQGHGTLMAGIAAYGALQERLSSRDTIYVAHCLESVKLLPPPPGNTERALWGYVTAQAVYRAEVQAPQRSRIVCMAVTASDDMDRGRPSSWSGQLDQLASGAGDDLRRLFIVSAGNSYLSSPADYPDALVTASVEDPAQSWNAVTVGAFTALDILRDTKMRGYSPLAQAGQLSPFTTTSAAWDNRWPVKPEIVMEGGNLAHNALGELTQCDDLSVLSTHRSPTRSLFWTFNATSAATAQAAWFSSQIETKYPHLWPESVRALMVHSAEWTEAMKSQFLPANPSKSAYAHLLRMCGYGVPNLGRALYSAGNSLTLIAQGELQPFDKKADGGYKTREMHLYDLPWPKEDLLALPPSTPVQMRVTLSYFVEPGPGEVGWKDRYRYASHQLRFDVNAPTETKEVFLRRINEAARTEEEGHPRTRSAADHWLIGATGRDRGSIHSDIWQGTAADLATSHHIAVYPVIGWWRERPHLNRWNRPARYSLIVSITTPEQNVDLYTPVAQKLGITIPIAT